MGSVMVKDKVTFSKVIIDASVARNVIDCDTIDNSPRVKLLFKTVAAQYNVVW